VSAFCEPRLVVVGQGGGERWQVGVYLSHLVLRCSRVVCVWEPCPELSSAFPHKCRTYRCAHCGESGYEVRHFRRDTQGIRLPVESGGQRSDCCDGDHQNCGDVKHQLERTRQVPERDEGEGAAEERDPDERVDRCRASGRCAVKEDIWGKAEDSCGDNRDQDDGERREQPVDEQLGDQTPRRRGESIVRGIHHRPGLLLARSM